MKWIQIYIIVFFASLGLVFSVGFHTASEVLPGTFSTGNFSFQNNVGIGTSNPTSQLHIFRDSSGGASAHVAYDDLIIEGNLSTGITIETSSYNAAAGIAFADVEESIAGGYFYNHNFDSLLFWANASEKMTILGNGNTGIGTSNPLATLQVNGSDTSEGVLYVTQDGARQIKINDTRESSAWVMGQGVGALGQLGFIEQPGTNIRLVIQNITGNVGIGTTDPSQKLDVVGNIEATAFFYSSDRNLKNNITPLTSQLDKVTQLQGVSFNWKENGREDIGVIAQDIEKIYPELVATDSKGIKSVQYGNLVAPLIEAIKEQQIQIDLLKEEVRLLKENG